jgi:hypothetical protein
MGSDPFRLVSASEDSAIVSSMSNLHEQLAEVPSLQHSNEGAGSRRLETVNDMFWASTLKRAARPRPCAGVNHPLIR